jgi:transglutaminase-like putative cysteine protease
VKYTTDGRLVHAISGQIEYRLENEKTARDFDYSVDFFAQTLVRTDRIDKPGDEITELRLRITGLTDDTAVGSARQKYEKESEGVYVLTVTMDTAPERFTSLGADRDRFEKELSRTTYIQSDNEEIVATAMRIVGDERDFYRKALLISDWVYWNVRVDEDVELSTALDVLHERAGTCSEKTVLFVALARAAGIPAREVAGLMYAGSTYTDEDSPAFAYHAWPEIYAGRWVALDPGWGQPLVDCTHVKLSDGEKDSRITRILGGLKVEVLEVK